MTLGTKTRNIYAINLRHDVCRATLADANDSRLNWPEVATLVVLRARKFPSGDDMDSEHNSFSLFSGSSIKLRHLCFDGDKYPFYVALTVELRIRIFQASFNEIREA